jgi:hypothetical protein
MTETLTIVIPHRLGKETATQRLKSGLADVEQQFRAVFQVEEQTWTGDTLQFQIRALGQHMRGTIEMFDDRAKLDVTLPWLIARLASRIQRLTEQYGGRLLEKK